MNIITITIIAIVAAVLLGFATKINIGLYAFAFAYLIGCFGLGLKPKEVCALLPTQLFFLFFQNGEFCGVDAADFYFIRSHAVYPPEFYLYHKEHASKG